jgi:hypothetical protein
MFRKGCIDMVSSATMFEAEPDELPPNFHPSGRTSSRIHVSTHKMNLTEVDSCLNWLESFLIAVWILFEGRILIHKYDKRFHQQ